MNNDPQIRDIDARFEFGKNWSQFLKFLNSARIEEAKTSLIEKLGRDSLAGKSFLDIGSGSGLFSLAAQKLGANVHSFDFDKDSVSCTLMLKEKYGGTNLKWDVEQGSILDREFLTRFQKFDIVYSWGVLHHTGQMYEAIDNASKLVADQGILFISIYNDQGGASKRWTWIKRKYNTSGRIWKLLLLAYTVVRLWTLTFLLDLLGSGNPVKSWLSYGRNSRGMSAWYDIVDWVGGYPFEVAKPEEIFGFLKSRNFELLKMRTCLGGHGCNEYVFALRSSR